MIDPGITHTLELYARDHAAISVLLACKVRTQGQGAEYIRALENTLLRYLELTDDQVRKNNDAGWSEAELQMIQNREINNVKNTSIRGTRNRKR